MEENKKTVKSEFFAIVIVQAACVLLILLGTVAVKYLLPSYKNKITKFYKEKICEKTDINDIAKYFGNEI